MSSNKTFQSGSGVFQRYLIWLTLSVCLLLCSACSTLLFKETRKFIQYPIQSGDSLYKIATRFNVTVRELEEVNEIDDPRKLSIGQVLLIPYAGQNLKRDRPPPSNSALASAALSKTPVDKSSLRKVMLGPAQQYIGKLAFPAKGPGTHISSYFGKRWMSFHEGIDIAGPVGTPVYSAHGGRVVYSGTGIRGYGNLVVVKGNGILTVYGHNHRNRVSVGDMVDKGDRIADLGASGKATGPHVHFETRILTAQGKHLAVDPMVFYPH